MRTLTDVSRLGRCALALAVVLLAARAASANGPNLLLNPQFIDSAVGWPGVAWTATDAGGNPHSGSVHVVGPAATGRSTFQCVPVVAGTSYVGAARARVDSGLNATNYADVYILFYATPDCSSNVIGTSQPVKSTTLGQWVHIETQTTAPAQARSAFLVLGAYNFGTPQGGASLVADFDDAYIGTGTCAQTPNVLCLNQGRFHVFALWSTTGPPSQQAMTFPLTDDSGSFWFFGPDNIEAEVKVLNGCGINGHYWVYAAGLTDVAVAISVWDTKSGKVKNYENPRGKLFQPVADVNAFATCP